MVESTDTQKKLCIWKLITQKSSGFRIYQTGVMPGLMEGTNLLFGHFFQKTARK